MSDFGHWTCAAGIELTEDTFGFLYRITNIAVTPNRYYIGKKQRLTKHKAPPLKGKKRKRISIKETDWKSYMGSSRELLEDIERYGKENFKFEILRACGSKFESAYFEAKMQFDLGVLFDDCSYNSIINCRIGRVPHDLLEKLKKSP